MNLDGNETLQRLSANYIYPPPLGGHGNWIGSVQANLTWSLDFFGKQQAQVEMLRRHVCRRLSERLDGVDHGPGGSIDKLLMTWVEQAVGHAALDVAGPRSAVDADDEALKVYLYSRAQSVMGGTSQIQKNIVATRILGLPATR